MFKNFLHGAALLHLVQMGAEIGWAARWIHSTGRQSSLREQAPQWVPGFDLGV